MGAFLIIFLKSALVIGLVVCYNLNIDLTEVRSLHLQESGEMYLETIYLLSKERTHVRAVDVSEHMGFSKPSVSRAVGLLKDAGLLELDPNGFLCLTPNGLDTAKKIYERHTILTSFLISIGVDEKIAADDACKIEHHISDDTLSAIKNYLDRN